MTYQPFSVAMSVYKNDNPVFFDRALDSITNQQTVKPNEIVLVVDGPVTDEINKVVEKYSSKYILNVIRLESNFGLGNALKIATENAKFDLVARMDSDDVSVCDRFEQELKLFENNERLDIVGGDITEFIDEEKNIVAKRVVPTENTEIKKYMKKRCAMNHVSVMFRKNSVLKAGGYLDWHYNEDYYLWIRMVLNGCLFTNTGTTLVNVRTGRDMYSRRGGRKYYHSEKRLQKYMLEHNFINRWTYFSNCLKRFIVQIIMPNKIRGLFFRKIARKM